jgi:drug/metabolite transporter (DMT)-like permease
MTALLAASLIWAFSFGLIKTQLAGVPPQLVAFLRLALSTLLFAPWFRPRRLDGRALSLLAAVGTVQYGAMYLAYLASFRYLKASEVALWTIFTPIYVVLLADATAGTFRRRNLAAAALSVLAAWWVSPAYARVTLVGIALVQLSNICFAAGQVWYRRLVPLSADIRDRDIFAALYLGGTLLVAIPVTASTGMADALAALTVTQLVTIGYLGLIPSGLAFYLWNAGVRRSREGTAAVLNNAKVPLAIVVSWAVFESLPPADQFIRTLVAVALMSAAVWLSESGPSRAATPAPAVTS